MKPESIFITSFDTDLGFMAIAADSTGVLKRIWFDYAVESELRSAIKSSIDRWRDRDERLEFEDTSQEKLVRRLKKFARGVVDTFADVKIDESWMTPFQQRVVRQARRIPYGRTLSYGELARKSSYPGAARAVGSVMAKNRYPLIVPCHRVVASDSRLGGFSSAQGLCTKSRLLEIEGAINKKGALVG